VQKLDQSRRLSEQDYGPFLEVATLFEHEGRFFLSVSAGYGPEKHNDEAWYELAEKLVCEAGCGPLDASASDGWLDPLVDQAEELFAVLGVRATKCPRPV